MFINARTTHKEETIHPLPKEQTNFVSHQKKISYRPKTRRVESLSLNLSTSQNDSFEFQIGLRTVSFHQKKILY